MRTLGISIARDRLSALLLERTLFATRLEFSCDVPCREPYGSAEEVRELAAAIRERAGAGDLPPAVICLPSAFTYVRAIELPAKDLGRAKSMQVAELDGMLPVEGDEILSDILPPSPGRPGRFLAIAARKSAVERTVSWFAEAGLPVGRVATEHLALFSAFLAGGQARDGLVLSTLSDLVVLRIEGRALTAARQFPAAMAERPDELAREWTAIVSEAPPGTPVSTVGPVPDALAADLGAAAPFRPPGNLGDASPLALGAALLPAHEKETGGFSLQTSAEAENAIAREKKAAWIVGGAAAVAGLSALMALQAAKWAMARKAAIVQAEIRKEVAAAAPDIRNFVNASAQIRAKIQSLAREQKEIGAGREALSPVLAAASGAFPAKEKMSVRELSYDAGKLRLSGDAENAGLVESYRASLAQAFGPGYSVTVESSQGSARGGSVAYTILVDTEARARAPKS